jgi:signal transduction histidine kinase
VAPVLFLWFRYFWRDLGALQEVANSIGKGEFEIDAQASSLSTLSPVALALTRMSHQVQQLLNAQRELTAAVGHELRTPITQLGFSLALVEGAASGNASAQKHIEGMRQDLAELDQLVDELLVYSRLDQGPPLDLKAVELRPVLAAIVAEVNATLRPGGVHVRLVGVIEGMVLCDAHLVGRAMSNLLRNAARYARTRVEMGVEISERLVTIYVDDDGPGIPVERRETIFEPFVRVDSSRSRSSGGYGLGLAIVRRTAVGHGGRAWMEDGPLGGLRACFAWEGVWNVTPQPDLVA